MASTDYADGLVPGAIVAGTYRIERPLGRGGMGEVHRAIHLATGRPVALKWMIHPTDELRLRMQREARTMGAIDHPNVVQVLDAGEHEGSFFLVMELLRGATLRDLSVHRRLPPRVVVDLIVPAIRGVEAAHRMGIVHRDLKPENLFVQLDAERRPTGVKVLDFGIARPLDADAPGGSVTRSGVVMGTPRYMAPEQIHGLPPDPRSDVFSLGVLVFELLTGRSPYLAERYESLVLEIATSQVPSPDALDPEIPRALAEVVRRATARDPKDRYEDVGALAAALVPHGSPGGLGDTGPLELGEATLASGSGEVVPSPKEFEATAPARPRVRAGSATPFASPVVPWSESTDPPAARVETMRTHPPKPRPDPRYAVAVAVAVAVAAALVVVVVALVMRRRADEAPATSVVQLPVVVPTVAPASPVPATTNEADAPAVVGSTTTEGMPERRETVAPTSGQRSSTARPTEGTPPPSTPPEAAPTGATTSTGEAPAPHVEAHGRAGVIRADDF